MRDEPARREALRGIIFGRDGDAGGKRAAASLAVLAVLVAGAGARPVAVSAAVVEAVRAVLGAALAAEAEPVSEDGAVAEAALTLAGLWLAVCGCDVCAAAEARDGRLERRGRGGAGAALVGVAVVDAAVTVVGAVTLDAAAAEAVVNVVSVM